MRGCAVYALSLCAPCRRDADGDVKLSLSVGCAAGVVSLLALAFTLTFAREVTDILGPPCSASASDNCVFVPESVSQAVPAEHQLAVNKQFSDFVRGKAKPAPTRDFF